MKLTKGKCVFALAGLYSAADGEHDEENKDILQELINEHFESSECRVESSLTRSNPPLKFEELKGGMWVWDNKEKMYGKIAHEPYQRFGLLTVPGYMWGVFEENRFYRREVINNED